MANPRRRGLTTNGILGCLETTDPVLDEWSEDEPMSSDGSGESSEGSDGESGPEDGESEPEGGGVIGVPLNDGGSLEGEVGAGGSTHGEEGLLRQGGSGHPVVGGEEGLLWNGGIDPGPGGEEGILEVGFSRSLQEDLNYGRIPTSLPELHLDLTTPGNNK